ncbi:MAG: PD-(D/E)XK nuclease family protein, partial [Candidatus Lokiarchaeota archaeon]
CKQCYGSPLENGLMDKIIASRIKAKPLNKHFSEFESKQPKFSAPDKLIHNKISSTQYQTLVDCPYQYFAKYILSLREQESTDEFEASDFGKLVHQCLYEFHFKRNEITTFPQLRQLLHYAEINFLIKFSKVENYSTQIERLLILFYC